MTTTAVGLALCWPRPVLLVEADPTGGSAILAGYLRGGTAPTDALIDLALAHRDGTRSRRSPTVTMPIPDTAVLTVPGIRAHAQARALPRVGAAPAALRGAGRTGQDVIVDAGRLGPGRAHPSR